MRKAPNALTSGANGMGSAKNSALYWPPRCPAEMSLTFFMASFALSPCRLWLHYYYYYDYYCYYCFHADMSTATTTMTTTTIIPTPMALLLLQL